jgi:hypothetical protein
VTDSQGGFEYDGRFYPWSMTSLGKDLMLVDRFCGMSISEIQAAPDAFERPSLMLAMIATSLRAGNPDWSVERLYQTVMNIDVETDIVHINTETEESDPLPETAAEPPTSEPSRSPSNGSSPPSTPPEPSSFETSFAAPV